MEKVPLSESNNVKFNTANSMYSRLNHGILNVTVCCEWAT